MTEATTAPLSGGAVSADVTRHLARCAEVLPDAEKLRPALESLKALGGPLPSFAAALFELECAKQGEALARSNMGDIADTLLQFWHDKSGDGLASASPVLVGLWAEATALLVSFQQRRFEQALARCWQVKGDAAELTVAIDALLPEGNRRVEFARCLYHLELARLSVAESRLQFARRIALVQEAYLDRQVADELVAQDEGLKHLWKDLVPYLDEFFEEQEQEAARASAAKTDPVGKDAAARTTSQVELKAAEASLSDTAPSEPKAAPVPSPVPQLSPPRPPNDLTPRPGTVALTPEEASGPPAAAPPDPEHRPLPRRAQSRRPEPPRNSAPPVLRPVGELPSFSELTAHANPQPQALSDDTEPEAAVIVGESVALDAPPPPPDTTPRPGPPPAELDEVEIVAVSPVGTGPALLPPPKRGNFDVLSDYEPTPRAQEFWRKTEVSLELLPDPKAPRVGQRVLSADDRGMRKKLNVWLDSMKGQYPDVPDARAMQCLLRLYMAAQVKEKTLFGAVNHKRLEAFNEALGLLSLDAEAAGRAAVWFELDGPETLEHLQSALETLADFLQFCARAGLSPLDQKAPARFLNLP